jgi:hypothetical protein
VAADSLCSLCRAGLARSGRTASWNKIERNTQRVLRGSQTHHSPVGSYGAAGNKFEPKAYDIDATKPINSVKEAWEAAKLRGAKILKGVSDDRNGEAAESADARPEKEKSEALACRFHDLRHTAVSRMLDAGVPIAKVAKIVGWSPATMVRMAARYGHFALEELRSAVESISRPEIQKGSPVRRPPRGLPTPLLAGACNDSGPKRR